MMRSVVALLPNFLQSSVRSYHHHRQLKRGVFRSPESEWDRLAEWVKAGDTVLDIGANVGHYTCKLSELTGADGRVFAFEPVPDTFAALASNVRGLPQRNVTLFNAAVGDSSELVGFHVPTQAGGSYLAHVDPTAKLKCFVLAVDALDLPGRVSFIKIDAEGHEPNVLAGLVNLLKRDRPVVLLEKNAQAQAMLVELGYTITVGPTKTPNVVALPPNE